MVKRCSLCGQEEVKLSSDPRFYWTSHGSISSEEKSCCGGGCCAKPAAGDQVGFLGKNALREVPEENPIEVMSTCLALIEIVDSCNMACPTCFADAPHGAGEEVDAVPLEELKTRINGVIERKGPIEILQLSGGEPTLHPQFFELIRWCQ